MSIGRIALIYDDQVRPDTTGVYCLRALRRLAEVRHVRPAELPLLEAGEFELYLSIDDGLDYALPPQLRPAALWAIDTHVDPGRIVRRARQVDLTFAAQRDGVELLRREGVACAGWLPLACDPSVHQPHELAKDIDISFVGHINCRERAELLTAIRAAYPNTFVGRRFSDEMARQYARSRIVFNRSVRNDVNMRVFEALGCGSLLVTNDLADNGLEEMFESGKHLVTYRSTNQLLEKLEQYLKDPESGQQIAAAGRGRALSRHTYLHRMSQLLREVERLGLAGSASVRAIEGNAGEPMAQTSGKPLESPLTSIIVLTLNELEYTKLCLQSVLERTDAAYELIVVDNGSTDGTLEYLRSVPGVRVIENKQNMGFPRAANQGIRAAAGERIVLLNNDVVVSSGWLGRLHQALDEDHEVGLAGPCSNRVSGPQQVPSDYADLSELDAFALRFARDQAGQRLEADRLVGFCLMIRRSLVERIGLLDERFGIGNFEDDDYCRRASRAGQRGVVVRDCFVHHFGSRTFLGSGIDRVRLLRENERLFREKWRSQGTDPDADGHDTDQAAAVPGVAQNAEPPVPATAAIGVEAQEASPAVASDSSDMMLSLCMIVRDSARTLPACLQSIARWVDEIIVVDTGSTDQTIEIALGFGASVHQFPWCDDFAAARNQSLRHARGRWIFWMDSDDTIDPACGRRLRQLARQDHDPSILGYVMQVRCPGPGEADQRPDVTAVDHVKLLRNRPDLRFEGRIHEQILAAIRRAGGQVGWTDLFVTHSGSDQSPEGRARKRERDLRLLKLELAERPGHPFTLFNLGMTYADGGDHAAAIDALRQSLAASAAGDSHVRKLYALLTASLCALGHEREALAACEEGLAACPGDAELLFRRATLLHRFGHADDAESIYLSLLGRGINGQRYFASIDVGILGHKVRHNLAVLHAESGRHEQAEQQWRAVLRHCPTYRPAFRGFVEALCAQGKLDQLAVEARKALADGTFEADGRCALGEVALARGELTEARSFFERAVADHPEDATPLSALSGFLFQHGAASEAAEVLSKLVRLEPDNPAAHHNLGTACLRIEQPAQALIHYRRSLQLRPNHPATLALLETAQRSARLLEDEPSDGDGGPLPASAEPAAVS